MTSIPAPLSEEEIAEIRKRNAQRSLNLRDVQLTWQGQAIAAADCEKLLAHIQHLQSEIARKDEALAPFVNACADLIEGTRDMTEIWEQPCAMSITVGNLRRPAAAMEKKTT